MKEKKNMEHKVKMEDGDEETEFIERKEAVPVPGKTADPHNSSSPRLCYCLPFIPTKWVTKADCAWGMLLTAVIIILLILLIWYSIPALEEEGIQQGSRDSIIATSVATEHDFTTGYTTTHATTLAITTTTATTTTTLEQDQQGEIVIGKAGTVEWTKACPADKYTSLLADLDVKIKYYGFTQVEDEIWLCGGKDEKHEQSTTCRVLNLLDGQWTIFEHQLKQSRIKSRMFVEGSRVIVMGGTTSDVNSKTGCRATLEVFDREKPEEGWTMENIEETNVCNASINIIKVYCH